MKTKTNKEIIKEFRKEFRPEYTGGGSIKNIIAYGKKLKSVSTNIGLLKVTQYKNLTTQETLTYQ